MKKFIYHLFAFAASTIVVVVIIFYITAPRANDSWFIFPESKRIIILGDSYTECAINDSVFSRSINLSQPAEAYFYSYIKLRKILPLNPQIDTVILGFSFLSLNAYTDSWYSSDATMSRRLPGHFQIMTLQDLTDAFFMNPNSFIKSAAIMYKRNVGKYIVDKTSASLKDLNIGKYLFLSRDIKQNKQFELDHIRAIQKRSFSTNQINYLRKINILCRNMKVKLLLLATPLHNSTNGLLDDMSFELLKSEFIEMDLVNFSNYYLPDSCFADVQHLNHKGAKVFSGYLELNL